MDFFGVYADLNGFLLVNLIIEITELCDTYIILCMISHTTGNFELKIYYSIKMTDHQVDDTIHNIWYTLRTVEVIEDSNLASYKTALPRSPVWATTYFLTFKYLHATV